MTIRGRKGFSLIELLVAMGLSIFVMGTIIMLSTSTVRSQLDSARKGSATGATLYGLVRMQAELENATYLSRPPSGTPTGDVLAGCTNWSNVISIADKRFDTSSSGSVTAFCYCVNGAELRRYSATTPASSPPACNLAALTSCTTGACGGSGYETVVYSKPGFFRQSNWKYFVRSNDVSGITLHGNVGSPAPQPENPNPSFFTIDTHISMTKSYNNTLD